MESILHWTWPHEETFRFYLVQIFFWSGYFFLTGLIGTFPYRFTRYNHTAWTTFVLGAMGALLAYLSQFLFELEEPLDMVSPYAVIVAAVATAVLAPLVSLFAFVCHPTYDYDDYDSYDRPVHDYDDRLPPRRDDREYEDERNYDGERVYNGGGPHDGNTRRNSRQDVRRRRSFR